MTKIDLENSFVPLGSPVAITDLSSATGLPSIPVGAKRAVIQAFTQNIRVDHFGGTPTASAGIRIAAGGTAKITNNLSSVQLIEEASSATAVVQYYGLDS